MYKNHGDNMKKTLLFVLGCALAAPAFATSQTVFFHDQGSQNNQITVNYSICPSNGGINPVCQTATLSMGGTGVNGYPLDQQISLSDANSFVIVNAINTVNPSPSTIFGYYPSDPTQNSCNTQGPNNSLTFTSPNPTNGNVTCLGGMGVNAALKR